jgi:hypothetical protein
MPEINIFVPLNINVNPQVATGVGFNVGVAFGNLNQSADVTAGNISGSVQLNRWN